MLLKLYFVWTALLLKALGGRRVELKTGDTTLLCYEIGPADGERWVLLHGLGATSLAWYPVIKRLRRRVRLLVPELSGLGGTRSPGGGLNVAEGVEAVRALIEWWAPNQPVTLAGISLGGWMAVKLALEKPELVSRLVLIDAGGYQDQDWDRIQELIDIRSLDDVDQLYGALFHRTPLILNFSRRGFFKAYTSRAVRHVLESTTIEHSYGPDDLARIEVPALVVWGEHDGLFIRQVGEAMAHHLRNSQMVVLEDAGHAVHWEKPSRLADALEEFHRQTA